MNRRIHVFLTEDLSNDFYRFAIMNDESAKTILTSVCKIDTLTIPSIRSILPTKINNKVRYIEIHKEYTTELHEIIKSNIISYGKDQKWIYEAGLHKEIEGYLKFISVRSKLYLVLKKAFKSLTVKSLKTTYQS